MQIILYLFFVFLYSGCGNNTSSINKKDVNLIKYPFLWPLCGRIEENSPKGWTKKDGCPKDRWNDSNKTDFPFSSNFLPRQKSANNSIYSGISGLQFIAPFKDRFAFGISLILIPADAKGISRNSVGKKQGWLCSETASIYFDNVSVPTDQIIGAENKGFKPIVHNFNNERIGMVAACLGASRVCLEEAAQWAQDRKTFGKSLSKHQVIQHKFAEMLRKINATQAYMDVCGWHIKNGTPDAADIAMLKVQASQTMEFCAREAMQIMGGISYVRECRTERIYREVRVMAIGGGSEEILRDLASRQMGL